MEHLLTSQPLFNSSKEKKETQKNRVLFKFNISEGKNGPNHLRKSYFIKLNSLTKRIPSNSKNITPEKRKKYFPLINTEKNNTITSLNKNKEQLKNKNISLKIHKRYKSKDEIIQPIMPYRKINFSNTNEAYIGNSVPHTDAETLTNNNNIIRIKNRSIKPKRYKKNIFDEIMEKSEANELKYVYLSKINKNKKLKNILVDPIKNNPNKIYDDIYYNPIRGDKNNKNEKIILGSKYTTFDFSKDSISKNIFYSKLNKFYNEIYDRKIINDDNNNNINLTKIDLHNLRLQKYHNQRIKQCKNLIDESLKEVLGVKKQSLKWINELKENYTDLYKGFNLESNDY